MIFLCVEPGNKNSFRLLNIAEKLFNKGTCSNEVFSNLFFFISLENSSIILKNDSDVKKSINQITNKIKSTYSYVKLDIRFFIDNKQKASREKI